MVSLTGRVNSIWKPFVPQQNQLISLSSLLTPINPGMTDSIKTNQCFVFEIASKCSLFDRNGTPLGPIVFLVFAKRETSFHACYDPAGGV